MKKNLSRISATILCIIFLFSVSAVPAFANSAQSYWEGVNQSGAIITDGDSPIIVEKELLTFDLQEFPKNYYHEVDEFLAYTGKVTAEYTFYNPSDITVTAKLLFPFGCDAQYADFYDYGNDVRLNNVDTEKYDILINGETIEKKIRHTLSSYHGQFVLDEDLGRLHDDFAGDSFYNPELTVTKYVFKLSGVDIEKYKAADVGFDVPKGIGSYRIYFPEQNGAHTQKDGDMRIHTSVQKNEIELELYVFGTPFATMPEWKAYQDGGVEDNETIAGTVELVSTETLNFKDFALANWNVQSGVSDVDWYNATVSEMKDSMSHYDNYPIVEPFRHAKAFDGSLMRWYEYEIMVEAGERIVNTVTAPIYPSIDLRYEPVVFGYTYLLSPAKTWKSFGELEIAINTPYYVSNCSIDGFAKTDSGYTVKLDGLPDGELTFNLSTSENPVRPVPPIILGVVGVVLLLGSGVATFILIRRRKVSIKM